MPILPCGRRHRASAASASSAHPAAIEKGEPEGWQRLFKGLGNDHKGLHGGRRGKRGERAS